MTFTTIFVSYLHFIFETHGYGLFCTDVIHVREVFYQTPTPKIWKSWKSSKEISTLLRIFQSTRAMWCYELLSSCFEMSEKHLLQFWLNKLEQFIIYNYFLYWLKRSSLNALSSWHSSFKDVFYLIGAKEKSCIVL